MPGRCGNPGTVPAPSEIESQGYLNLSWIAPQTRDLSIVGAAHVRDRQVEVHMLEQIHRFHAHAKFQPLSVANNSSLQSSRYRIKELPGSLIRKNSGYASGLKQIGDTQGLKPLAESGT